MKTHFLNIFIAAFLFAISCNPNSQSTSSEDSISDGFMEEHTAQNSLDWFGTYSGIEPCADCEGIKHTLTLHENLDYEFTIEYLTVPPLTETKNGKFTWKDGNTIELDAFSEGEGSNFFKIEENQIRHLNLEAKTIEGNLANFYVLKKKANLSVDDKKWQLMEILGKEIDSNPENYFIHFDSKENRIHAKANCNVLNLPYSIENETRLNIGDGISTRMACPDDTEERLLEVLRSVNSFETTSNQLYLFKDHQIAPLAKFILIE